MPHSCWTDCSHYKWWCQRLACHISGTWYRNNQRKEQEHEYNIKKKNESLYYVDFINHMHHYFLNLHGTKT